MGDDAAGGVGRALDEGEVITAGAVRALDKVPGQDSLVDDVELGETVVGPVENGRDVENVRARGEGGVRFNVTGHTVDDVSHGLARVGPVGVVVDDGAHVDGTVVANGEDTLVPVDVAREVGIDTVLEEELLESSAHAVLVARNLRRVHGTVAHGDNPGGLLAVNLGKVILEPLVLFVRLLDVNVASDGAKGARVGREGLVGGDLGLTLLEVLGKGSLGGVGVVSLTVEGDEVSKTIVEGVPEVGDTLGLGTRHTETVLVSSVVALGRRAAEVVELGGGGAVGLVEVEVGGEGVLGVVKLGASSLVVTGKNHVGDLGGDVGHPLLPEIPVGLVDDAHITTTGTTLASNLASR